MKAESFRKGGDTHDVMVCFSIYIRYIRALYYMIRLPELDEFILQIALKLTLSEDVIKRSLPFHQVIFGGGREPTTSHSSS